MISQEESSVNKVRQKIVDKKCPNSIFRLLQAYWQGRLALSRDCYYASSNFLQVFRNEEKPYQSASWL